MYTLLYDPFREIRRFQGRRNRGWRGFLSPEARTEGGEWPLPLDVAEWEDGVIVTASVPGFRPEDIDVTIADNVLTIGAKAESASEPADETAGERFIIRERRSGAFQRSIRLPESVNADGAATRYEHGVLSITLPKAEEKKARRLTVTAGS